MQKLTILKSREIKKIENEINSRFGSRFNLKEYTLLRSEKKKYYILSKDFYKLNDKKIKINNLGLYFGKYMKGQFRVSIEGAQLIGATINVYTMTQEDVARWVQGENLEIKPKNLTPGPVIMRYKEDILGCGIFKNNIIINNVPKERRIKNYR